MHCNVTAGLWRTAHLGVTRLASSRRLFCLPHSMCSSATANLSSFDSSCSMNTAMLMQKVRPKHKMFHLSNINAVRHMVRGAAKCTKHLIAHSRCGSRGLHGHLGGKTDKTFAGPRCAQPSTIGCQPKQFCPCSCST